MVNQMPDSEQNLKSYTYEALYYGGEFQIMKMNKHGYYDVYLTGISYVGEALRVRDLLNESEPNESNA